MERKKLILIVLAILGLYLLIRGCGGASSSDGCVYDSQYDSFVGTYEVDLTLSQSGSKTTIVLNPDGSGYFQQGDHYESKRWWPADNGGGIYFSGGGDDSRYFMNKSKTQMYWGLNNYMNDRNGYKVKKIN